MTCTCNRISSCAICLDEACDRHIRGERTLDEIFDDIHEAAALKAAQRDAEATQKANEYIAYYAARAAR
jgi:hypothetical protein